MQNVEKVYDKFRKGLCTREEAEALLAFFRTNAGDAEMARLVESFLENAMTLPADSDESRILANEKRLMEHISKPNPLMRIRPYWVRGAAVAVIVAIIFFGVYRYRSSAGRIGDHPETLTSLVPPGGQKATLTLSGGDVIVLSEAHDGIILDTVGIRYQDGTPVWGEQPNTEIGSQSLTVTTPRGGYYHVILSDGTKVWLNAASMISYPSRFTDQERRVSLRGEAYFEVSSRTVDFQDIPFIVEVDGQEIKVLGTQFNIRAYPDEPSARTTVVTGSVRVTDLNGHSPVSMVLGANQQCSRDEKGLKKNIVNAADHMAWKENLFVFHHTKLEDLLRQVSRWYDIDVDYDGLPDITYFGEISREVELGRVLEMLEQSTEIKFMIEKTKHGRRITMDH